MNALIIHWARGREDSLTLFEDGHAITLQRLPGTLRLGVQLTLHRPDNAQLETWMRPGEPSLNHFQGALAQAPDSGALWLVQCLPLPDDLDDKHVLSGVENLLNQRDAWRAMIARQLRPALPRPSLSLRSLAH
ncbi:type III secretion protein [Pseudomonas sp. UBT]|uniref:type III secretion protein n=1 Tax=Pseudomonas sp. UBT TaxID=3239198 RepID=UPI003D8065D6